MLDNASGRSDQPLPQFSQLLQPTIPARNSPAEMYRSFARIVRPSAIPLQFLPPSINPSKPLHRCISTSSPRTPPPIERPAQPSPKPTPSTLPHLTPTSEIHIISTSSKTITQRVAVAIGHVCFSNPEPLRLIREHGLTKGDVLAVARVAGIQAVKKTADIIPLAHPSVPVEGCVVRVEPVDGKRPKSDSPKEATAEQATGLTQPISPYGGVRIAVSVETTAKTGIEMEALTGVMGAALTIVDMCKGVDRQCAIKGVRVVGKKGGRSGEWGFWGQEGANGRKADTEDAKTYEVARQAPVSQAKARSEEKNENCESSRGQSAESEYASGGDTFFANLKYSRLHNLPKASPSESRLYFRRLTDYCSRGEQMRRMRLKAQSQSRCDDAQSPRFPLFSDAYETRQRCLADIKK